MSDYIITTNGMVPVSDDVLMHWKYIKRVKKNGKWKYYYDTDQLKKDFQNSKLGNAIGYDERNRFNSMKPRYNQALKRFNDAYAKQQEAREKSQEEMRKYYNNPNKPKGGYLVAQQQEASRSKDVQKILKEDAHIYDKYERTKYDYYNTPLGKLEKPVEKGKAFIKSFTKKVESAKDKAGVDEKERLKNAAANRATSESEREVNLKKYVTSYDEYNNAEHPQLKQEAKRRMDVHKNSYESSRNKVSKARSEYEKALNEYINTPIGKIEDSIYFMQGQKYYERLLKSRRKIKYSDGSVKYLHEKD